MRPTFFERYGRGKKFYPVIHVETPTQALRNAKIALNAGAHGMFLINHDIHAPELLRAYLKVREQFPNEFIGLNLLDQDVMSAILNADLADASAVWADDADFTDPTPSIMAKQAWRAVQESKHGLQYFASVAFKGQQAVSNATAAAVAATAAEYCHVVVTSGPRTGSAPDVEKIAGMKARMGDAPLAIASGITPDNVEVFLPYADGFLVATGISDSFTELNEQKATTLGKQICNFSG